MTKKYIFRVQSLKEPLRLDSFLSSEEVFTSRSQVQNLIKKGQVLLTDYYSIIEFKNGTKYYMNSIVGSLFNVNSKLYRLSQGQRSILYCICGDDLLHVYL